MYQYAKDRDAAVKIALRSKGKKVKLRYCSRNITVPAMPIPSYVGANNSYGTPEYYADSLWIRRIGSTIEIAVNNNLIRRCDEWHTPQDYKDDSKMHRGEIKAVSKRIAHYENASKLERNSAEYEAEMTLGYTY